MAGFGPSKTIVIKDIYLVKLNTLKEGGNKTEILANNTTTDDEILAVLGHGSSTLRVIQQNSISISLELGHWKNWHILRGYAFEEVDVAEKSNI